jgi:hypothetical protein
MGRTEGENQLGKTCVFALVMLFLMLGLSVSAGHLVAATSIRTAGVMAGDSADYSVHSYLYLPDVNRFYLQVTDVQGPIFSSIVSFNVTFYRASGSIYDTQAFHSVNLSYPNENWAVIFLIAAYLSPGDTFYTTHGDFTGDISFQINATAHRFVAGSIRAVNYVPGFLIGTPDVSDQPWGSDMYWDKGTGLSIEGHVLTMVGWFNWTITSMSLGIGSHGNDPAGYYILGGSVALVVALVAAIAVIARRK